MMKGAPDKKVLFVDDDDAIAPLCRRAFGKAGMEVLFARTTDEAFDRFQQESPSAVVVDGRLGDGSGGLDLLGRIMLQRPVPAVIHTTYGFFRDNFLSWAADEYVLKTPDLSSLVQTVARLLEEREAHQSQATPTEMTTLSAAR